MKLEDRQAIFFTLLIGSLVIAGLVYDPDAQPPILPAVKTADSLVQTRPAFQAAVDSSVRSAVQKGEGSVRASGRARVAQASADSIRAVADSLAAEARRGDSSATAWERAHAARKDEADSLRVALRNVQAATDSARLEADEWKGIYLRVAARNMVLERNTARFASAVAGMEPKCKIGPVPCPSRTATGIVAFGLGVALSFR